MRSMRGVLGASVLVLALPATIVYQLIFSAGAEAFIHGCLALGAFLVAAAARDFRTPRWATWLGSASSAALGVAFGLQAVSSAVPNDALYFLAYTVLGPLELLFVAGLLGWLLVLSLAESQGTRRILGWAALLAAAGAAVFSSGSILAGASSAAPQGLRLVYLLPILWLLLTSIQSRQQPASPQGVSAEPAPQSA